MSMSPSIRQLLVMGACLLGSLSCGGAMGYPMVLLHQLRKEDSPIQLDLDSASWIGSMHGVAGIASIIVPSFMQWRGRKAAFIASCLAVILGWIIAYCATSVAVILVSEFIHGLGTNALHVVAVLSMAEMTSPRYRNIFVQAYSIVQAFGMAMSGILSTCLSSKLICTVMIIPILIAFVMTLFWVESPSWLACKGRFDETYTSFKQLRTVDVSSKKELEDLITAQRENLSCQEKDELSMAFYWEKIKRRDFYIPTLHTFVLLNLVYGSGTAVITINSFELIQKTTLSDKAAFLGGIIINAMIFIGSLISCLLNKRFKNKPILLVSEFLSVICLFSVFVTTLLQSLNIASKESFVCMYLFIAYAGFNSLGVIPIVFTITSEIMPVKHRGIGGAIYIFFNSMLFAITLKTSTYLFFYINVWGTFILYTCNAIVCTLIIWKYVPETKNKSLQQIEDYYMFGKFIKRQNCESKTCESE